MSASVSSGSMQALSSWPAWQVLQLHSVRLKQCFSEKHGLQAVLPLLQATQLFPVTCSTVPASAPYLVKVA